MALLSLLWSEFFGVSMIYCREFSTIHEIDPEFIPSLESLLGPNLPDLKILEEEERTKSDQEYFVYHLFFGQKTNAPIGFAKAIVHIDKEVKPTFLNKILGKDGLEKSVRWNITKDHHSGFVFEPGYGEGMKEASFKAIQKMYKSNEVLTQELLLDDFQENTFTTWDTNITELSIPDALLKNNANYGAYLNSLPKETEQKIKGLWKSIYQDPEIKFGEYQSFKDVFSYKDRGAEQYKELKSKPEFTKYPLMEGEKIFLTLENEYEVLALIVYTPGKAGNSFFEILHGREYFDVDLFIQMAIIKFYEEPEASYLHALHRDINEELYLYQFAKKNQKRIVTGLKNYDSHKLN